MFNCQIKIIDINQEQQRTQHGTLGDITLILTLGRLVMVSPWVPCWVLCCSGHSTVHALIDITERIRKCLDRSEFAGSVFVDLQNAFDTVDHKILLDYYDIT